MERLPVRAIALVTVVLLAYHYSLSTLARGLALQTPLAYLGLVPAMALILGWIRLGREPTPRPIHDRQVDYIVGFGLIGVAVALLVLLPTTLATRFWLYRIDLLSLPIFVAAMVSLLWGVRRLWALKAPIVFLLFAWPLPYTPLVSDWSEAFTTGTAAALSALSRFIPVASPAPGDGLVFYVGDGLRAFAVTVGSACSGVNSLVGFVLIGSALAYVVRGPLARRVAWLASGLVMVWLLNIVRIEAIFVAGATFGRDAALEGLHPAAGLVVFNLGIVAMLGVLPRFGLHFVSFKPIEATALRAPTPTRRPLPAVAVCAVMALSMAFVNASLARYEAIATPLGEARRLEPFDIRTAQVPGWDSQFMASNKQGTQFFGAGSTWDRLQYSPTAAATIRADIPIYLDIIGTDDPGTLAEYTVEECYTFHGYQIESIATIDIGAGVTAQVIDYRNKKIDADWSAIWWEWPYQRDGRTWFERIVVFVASGPQATYEGLPDIDIASQSARFGETDRFLAGLARQIVESQVLRTARQ